MAFDDHSYNERLKDLAKQTEAVEAERTRAAKIWKDHLEPLSHEDKKLALQLLYTHIHGDGVDD